MRNSIVSMVVLIFFLLLPGGCTDSPKHEPGNETLIGIKKQHDTRVFILFKDSRGDYHEKSFHESAEVICGGTKFKMKDFKRICKTDCYIAFPGQEKEIERYLIKFQKK
jgi:hypothetical protein